MSKHQIIVSLDGQAIKNEAEEREAKKEAKAWLEKFLKEKRGEKIADYEIVFDKINMG